MPVATDTSDSEGQHPKVDGDSGQRGQQRWKRGGDHAQQRKGENESGCPSDQSHDDALGEELPDDPQPAGAERHPDADLAAPRAGAREQQVAEIGACDEQHEGNRRQQEQQRRAGRADQCVVEVDDRNAPVPVLRRIGSREPRRDRRQLQARGIGCGVRPDMRQHQERVVAALDHPRVEVQRRQQVGSNRKGEVRRQNTDNRERRTAQHDRAADHVTGAAEPTVPEAVGQDHRRVGGCRLDCPATVRARAPG